MYRRMLRQTLRLTLLATLVVLVVSACGGNQQVSKPQPLPEEREKLRTGVYRTEEFKPPLSFRVGEGWSNDPPEASDALLLTRDETVGLGFVNAQWVFKPTKTGTPQLVEPPEDMVGWFQQHPYLRTSEPEPATVGGVKGVQFDVDVVNLQKGNHCVNIFALSTGGPSEACGFGNQPERYIVLEDVKGVPVVIRYGGENKFVPVAEKVLQSVEWTGT